MAKFYYLLATILLGASTVMAEDVEFTYAPNEGAISGIGAGRKNVWNDMAIRINNPGYTGYQITGVSIDVPVADRCECDPNAKVWLAKELAVSQEGSYECITDISYDAKIVNYGTEAEPVYRVDFTFPEPYTITADGIYVGYSLMVSAIYNSNAKWPLQVISSSNPDGGMYVHFSYNTSSTIPALAKNKEFQNLGVENSQVSTMRVFLHGEKAENECGVEAQKNIIAPFGENVSVNATLTNYGGNDVTELTYVFTPSYAGASVQTGSITLDAPLASMESVNLTFPFVVPDENGDYGCDLTINTVNGVENGNSSKSARIMVYSRQWIPTKRVLAEEYTGLWCHSCPAAYVAVRQLEDKYPDNMEVVVFHSGDSMQTVPFTDFPFTVSGAPYLFFDRVVETSSNLRLSSERLSECADEMAPADINVNIYWTDDSKNEIRAEADLHFVDPAEADQYRLTYVLVEDDMSDPAWTQNNMTYYSQDPSLDEWYRTPYWDLFIGTPAMVDGLVFNSVALVTADALGIPESVPAVEADGRCKHFTMLSLAKATYLNSDNQGKSIIKDKNKLRVVASLIDKNTGKVVNTNSSVYAAEIPVYDPSIVGVEIIDASQYAEVVAEEYYTLDGIRLPECPSKGATIVVRRYSDGSVKTAKVMQ